MGDKNKLKIGILRENKVPPDRRVPLLPEQCQRIQQQFPWVEFYIQPSDTRCFANKEYVERGLKLREDLSHCDMLMGIKEIPPHLLLPNKTYLFFTHTMKKQPQNQKMLQAILEKKIHMIDYECIRDENEIRLIAFGRYAGIVGAYNALLLYGKKYNLYHLKPAYQCFDYEELKGELAKAKLPPIKMVTTGGGRVGKGICELLDLKPIQKVDTKEFLQKTFKEAVYTSLDSKDYHIDKVTGRFDRQEFHKHPENYKSTFLPFTQAADVLIAGAFWHPDAPVLFTKEDMKRKDFKIRLIADVTCDFNGSIPSTIKPTSIYDPAYDYNPDSEGIEPPLSDMDNILTMAIENLPSELPRNASSDFGELLIRNVFPELLGKENSPRILQATIAQHGKLTPRYSYLQDYVDGL